MSPDQITDTDPNVVLHCKCFHTHTHRKSNDYLPVGHMSDKVHIKDNRFCLNTQQCPPCSSPTY